MNFVEYNVKDANLEEVLLALKSLYLLSHIGKLYYIIRYKGVCQIKILS